MSLRSSRRDLLSVLAAWQLLHHVLHRARKWPVTVNRLPAVNYANGVGLTGFEPATP